MKRVIILGAYGKMGRETVNAIDASKEFECVAKISSQNDLSSTLNKIKADIAIDFTTAEQVYRNSQLIIQHNIHPIIGSSGLHPEQIDELSECCKRQSLGGIIAPNFSIGAILMMQCAALVGQYFSEVEIIESHHPQKLDAPSGTAIKTAEMIAQQSTHEKQRLALKELIPGARGATLKDINIHSIRLPGIIANQEVRFGGMGETLSIHHNSLNRESFMPGVLMACQKVTGLTELIYGLEHVLSPL